MVRPNFDTLYSLAWLDLRGGLGYPVPNPVGRYAIGDRDKLSYNGDGAHNSHPVSPADLVVWLKRQLP